MHPNSWCKQEIEFFKWSERLETGCLQSWCDIQTETLGWTDGDVQDCLRGSSIERYWTTCGEELKGCYSYLSSLGHPAAWLKNMTQWLDKSLHLYIHRYSKMQYAATGKAA